MSSLANKKVHLASHGSPGATAGDHRRRFIDVAPNDVLDEFVEVTEEQPGRIAVTRCLLGLEEVDERRHQPAPVVAETAPLVASGMIRVPIAATYPLTAFRETVAHVQRGGKVMFDVSG
jgi:hypothetical protein